MSANARGFAAKFIVRKRTVDRRESQYGPQVKYGKWVNVSKRDTQEEAVVEMQKIDDSFDKAIYYRGERITKERQRQIR